jgi:hypothetical protein
MSRRIVITRFAGVANPTLAKEKRILAGDGDAPIFRISGRNLP